MSNRAAPHRDGSRTLWIINHYAQDRGGRAGTRHLSIARHLPELGWKAIVIAAAEEHHTGARRLPDGVRHGLEMCDGVPFLWVSSLPGSGRGGGRVAGMFRFAMRAAQRAATQQLPLPDVVLGSTVHPLAPAAARRLARRHGVPFLLEVRDLWPETLIEFGKIGRHGPVAIALRRLELSLFRSASRIITVLPRMVEYVAARGLPRGKVVWIPNGVDVERFDASPPPPGNSTLRLMYFGSHGQANSLDTLIDAMAVLGGMEGTRAVELRLVGEGPLKDRLKSRARALGLQNVAFEPAVPNARIPEIAREADAFVLPVLNRPGLYRYGVSMNKLFDFMAAARPVLIAMDAPANPIAEAGAGLVVPPEDPRAFAEAVLHLVAMGPGRRRELGLAGRRYVEEHHTYRTLAARLATTLDEVCG